MNTSRPPDGMPAVELAALRHLPSKRLAAQARVAVVLPAYREAANLPLVLTRIHQALDGKVAGLFVVVVDDGSPDDTAAVLEQLTTGDPCVVALMLGRNFGHQAALTAGMDAALALGVDVVATMDADLQHPPELLGELLAQWERGADLVLTQRTATQGAGVFTRASSALLYVLINAIGNHRVTPGGADFRLMSAHVCAVLANMREPHRFLRGMTSWMGFATAQVAFEAPPRARGTSAYSLGRRFALGWDALLDSGLVPLRLAAWVGLLILLASGGYGTYVAYVSLVLEIAVPGWTSLMLVTLFLGSIQLLALGLVGEYLGRVYMQGKQRPLYTVARVVGAAGHRLTGPP